MFYHPFNQQFSTLFYYKNLFFLILSLKWKESLIVNGGHW